MSGTGETTIRVNGLHAVGRGVDRPEQVVVAGDGRVFASGRPQLSQKSLMRTPFDIWGMRAASRMESRSTATANFGLSVMQDLDPVTGAIAAVLGGQLDGRPLRWLNFVLVDSTGALWCSVSTLADDLVDTIARGTADGFIFRVAPDRRSARVVADAVSFPNCMALDRNETICMRSAP